MQIPTTPCKFRYLLRRRRAPLPSTPHLPALDDIVVMPKGEMSGRGAEQMIQQIMGGMRSQKYNASCDLRNGAGKIEIKFSERHQDGRYNFSNIVGFAKACQKWDILILVGRRAHRISSETSLDSEFFFISLTWDETNELLRNISSRGSMAIPEWLIPGSTAVPTYRRKLTAVQKVLVRNFRTAAELRVMGRQVREAMNEGPARSVIRRTKRKAKDGAVPLKESEGHAHPRPVLHRSKPVLEDAGMAATQPKVAAPARQVIRRTGRAAITPLVERPRVRYFASLRTGRM